MAWQGKLHKIADYRYEIPQSYKPGMRTSGIIYATEKMLPSILKDNAPEQVANVATLPGIIGKSLAMPDIHWGYGFAIGGVAAFDAQEGIISPGGVGYDINCLTKNTDVLLYPDCSKKLSNFERLDGRVVLKPNNSKQFLLKSVENYSVASLNKHKIKSSKILNFMRMMPSNRVLRVVTQCGNIIEATEEHPFLTPTGMRPLKHLKIGATLATVDKIEKPIHWDKIEELKEIKYDDYVYDLTIQKTHNFIANNFVVSNCGVRLLKTNLDLKAIQPKIKELIDNIFVNVPSGVGSRGKLRLQIDELDQVLADGAKWAVEKGYGWEEDLERLEENGRMKKPDPTKVSQHAKARGAPQLGTLGAGNHFLEIERVDEIYNEEVAKAFGILHKDQILVLIHTGSRGFGHQVCTDHLRELERAVHKYGLSLPDRQLACAPAPSSEAQSYFRAMQCAANYAWCNRQMIVHWTRESFERVLKTSAEKLDMHIIYDVAHNIAKYEEHEYEGKKLKLYVHRKGATRAFPKAHPDIPSIYREVGQPVLIPGDMGTASYVLVGTPSGKESFFSTCHGAGRVMSRHEAIKRFRVSFVKDLMQKKNIYTRAASRDVLCEEAPDAYKRIDDVVEAVHGAGLSNKVARLKPVGVMKG